MCGVKDLTPVGPKRLREDDVPGLDFSDESGYCMTSSAIRYANGHRAKRGDPPLSKTYFDWEKEEAEPKLRELGYETNGCWYDGESDSFGPMSRCLVLQKDGKAFVFCYG